jgi:hypothetical protein
MNNSGEIISIILIVLLMNIFFVFRLALFMKNLKKSIIYVLVLNTVIVLFFILLEIFSMKEDKIDMIIINKTNFAEISIGNITNHKLYKNSNIIFSYEKYKPITVKALNNVKIIYINNPFHVFTFSYKCKIIINDNNIIITGFWLDKSTILVNVDIFKEQIIE